MANNKLFGIKSAYILLLVLMVSALCLPAAVCAYVGEPVLEYEYSFYPVTAGTTGTANVRIAETGGYDYAANVVVALSTDTKGVSFGNPQTISKLGQGESRVLTFPIYVDSSVKAGKYIGMLTISYDEYGNNSAKNESWLMKWRKEHEGELDDLGFDITPSRECPDYSKDPWA